MFVKSSGFEFSVVVFASPPSAGQQRVMRDECSTCDDTAREYVLPLGKVPSLLWMLGIQILRDVIRSHGQRTC